MKYKIFKLYGKRYVIEVFTEYFGWVLLFNDEGNDMRSFNSREEAEEWIKNKNYDEVIFI